MMSYGQGSRTESSLEVLQDGEQDTLGGIIKRPGKKRNLTYSVWPLEEEQDP